MQTKYARGCAAGLAAAALVLTGSTAFASQPEESSSLSAAGATIAVTTDADVTELESVGDAVLIEKSVTAGQEMSGVFDLPSGSTLVGDGEGTGAVAFDANGDPLFSVTVPVAVDASGAAVAASMSVAGDAVVVAVDDSVSDADVSIMAITDLISKVTRASTSQGVTYRVQPTALGRAASETVHVISGWPEAVRKGVADRTGLREQYLCHPLSQVARVKSTWNLDTWRPTVGLAATVAAACNP